jgi:hypothetical protein
VITLARDKQFGLVDIGYWGMRGIKQQEERRKLPGPSTPPSMGHILVALVYLVFISF